MRVLVIDDHEGFREEILAMLGRNGYEADTAGSAMQAVPLVESGAYDLVLLDYQMPEHDGLWFLRTARIPTRTKVILVTCHAYQQLINEMFRAGAAGYLIKPFEEEDLLRHLEFHSHGHTPHATT